MGLYTASKTDRILPRFAKTERMDVSTVRGT
jgi:hypothetical protein